MGAQRSTSPAWLCVLACTGCDYFLGLRSFSDADASVDSTIDAPVCAPPTNGFEDPFTTTAMPCTPWGQPLGIDTNNLITEVGGRLHITRTTGPGVTSCQSQSTVPISLDARGIFVGVEQTLATSGGYTTMQIRDQGGTWHLSIGVESAMIHMALDDGGGTSEVATPRPYSMSSMKYWRVRADQSAFVGEVSPDAARWTELGRTSVHFTNQVYLVLAAGYTVSVTASDGAEFSHLNVCP